MAPAPGARRGPGQRSLAGSDLVTYEDLEFELVEEGACRQIDRLERMREEVLSVAAVSRGWDRPEDLDFFRRKFKLEPFFEADALALVRRRGRLVGLAGTVNRWPVAQGSIVHLCSLGLLREVQARGILPVLLYLLWQVTLEDPMVWREYRGRRLFVTAITQSPYVLGFLRRLGDLYPAPERSRPAPDEVAVARRVVARFDAHIPLDEEAFILRNECEFRYQKTPYGLDRRYNRFCDERLRYDAGDVFVGVSRVDPERLEAFLDQVRAAHPALLAALDRRPAGHRPAAVSGRQTSEASL